MAGEGCEVGGQIDVKKRKIKHYGSTLLSHTIAHDNTTTEFIGTGIRDICKKN